MSGSTIKCPSGLAVTLREFTVSDENLLANKKAIRLGTEIDFYLDYGLKKPDHDEEWRLFHPKGF